MMVDGSESSAQSTEDQGIKVKVQEEIGNNGRWFESSKADSRQRAKAKRNNKKRTKNHHLFTPHHLKNVYLVLWVPYRPSMPSFLPSKGNGIQADERNGI